MRKEKIYANIISVRNTLCVPQKGGVFPIKKTGFRATFRKYALDFFQHADIFLLVICLICSAISLFAVKTATGNLDAAGYGVGSTKCVIVQSASILIGVGAFVLFTFVDPDILGNQWKILAAVNILLMIALIIFGSADDTGNKSWIRFAGIGIQPSEVIKILYVIVSAKQMTYLKEYKDINSFPSVVMMAGHFALVFLAIQVISSDLGSATIILAIFLVMFFCLGVKLYWFVIGFAAVAAVVPLLWTYFLKGYQKQRLLAPYDPSVDPEGYGIRWQTIQSRTTLASGRMTGVDAGHSTVFTGKHTDFIFSCIGEQLGMIGCIVVMILLTIIILRCYYIGIHSGRTFDMLVCCGMGTAIAFQTFINMGMCLGITPVIGLTLPFFSYGGSSMVTLFAAMGVVSGVKYKPKPERFTLAT